MHWRNLIKNSTQFLIRISLKQYTNIIYYLINNTKMVFKKIQINTTFVVYWLIISSSSSSIKPGGCVIIEKRRPLGGENLSLLESRRLFFKGTFLLRGKSSFSSLLECDVSLVSSTKYNVKKQILLKVFQRTWVGPVLLYIMDGTIIWRRQNWFSWDKMILLN